MSVVSPFAVCIKNIDELIPSILGSQDLISSDIDKLRKTRTELATVLKRTCRNLTENNNFEHLAEYIDQYQQSHKEDEAIANQTMGTYKKRLEELRTKVQQKQGDIDHKLKEMDQNIQTLQDTEVELKQLILSRQKFFQKDQAAGEAILKSQNEQTEREAQQQISKLKEQVQYEVTAHKQVMEFLAWQRDEYGKEVEKFMDKFEQENEEKTKELAYLKDLKDDLAGKTREMQSQYEILSKQVAEEKEERRKKFEAIIKMRAQVRCSRIVQKWWRKVRAERKARKEAAEATAAAAKGGKPKKKGKK